MESGEERAIQDSHPKSHDPGSPNAPSADLEKLPFRLQHGERIIRELKPQFVGFILTQLFGSYLIILAFAIISSFAFLFFGTQIIQFLGLALLVPLFILVILLLISIKPVVQYGKSWYWITNHRVIGKRGFLGYSINSIPLENVADVVLTRTLLDRVLGLSSLIIVSMGNNPRSEGELAFERSDSPNFFPALTQETARELQRVLFNLRDDMKSSTLLEQAGIGEAGYTHPTHHVAEHSTKGSTQESVQPRRVGSESNEA
jgi:uncharacterized membrane protein YdbT with pleckstrin-like domain